ncbi:hypothetical protein [Cupriavidus metallidurans]|uniref:hypothetical protein n=1 Tax=Cupriavidus metallidurans TaxID=119219 RepID=UPI000CE011C7|nr:hypothetical protein [Cupriavidus metallidurans]AVA33362.1 hypothetical protein C3Z06_06800 [Cupriavidus metallidurans]
MDAATLQSRIYAGYGKAAQRIGYVHNVYRPSGAGNPLATVLTTLNAAFSAQEWTFTRPNLPDKPYWYALVDGTLLQMGDYLQRAGGSTYFIAGLQSELPILAVECNRTVWVTRPAAPSAVGNVGYSGQCDHVDSYLIGVSGGAGWPASILFGGKTRTHAELPASGDEHGFRIMLPVSAPVTLQAGDTIADDLGRRYIIGGAELTDQMWRIDATEVHA